MDVTFDANGDIDRQGFLVEIVEGKQSDQEGIAEARQLSRGFCARCFRPARASCRTQARESMSNLLDLLVAGLATGAIYALVAVGFTLLWQTSQTINFAQGEFVMLPAFLMLAAMHVGAPFWLAILIGILLSLLLLGLGFKMLLVDPMLRHGVLPLAIATMALAIGIKESGQTVLQRRGLAVSVDGAGRRHLDLRRA